MARAKLVTLDQLAAINGAAKDVGLKHATPEMFQHAKRDGTHIGIAFSTDQVVPGRPAPPPGEVRVRTRNGKDWAIAAWRIELTAGGIALVVIYVRPEDFAPLPDVEIPDQMAEEIRVAVASDVRDEQARLN